jgi:hypothetical protein
MRRLQTAAGIMTLLLLSGCATAPITEKSEVRNESVVKPAVVRPAEKSVIVPLSDEGFDLLSEGIALLSLPDRPDSMKARSVFASLLQRHPRSRWRSAAETFIRLIDEAEVLLEINREKLLLLEKAQTEHNLLLHENEHLRKTIHELTERLQVETAALTQENEKLKKDLQSLKALEIELQKRERMLR